MILNKLKTSTQSIGAFQVEETGDVRITGYIDVRQMESEITVSVFYTDGKDFKVKLPTILTVDVDGKHGISCTVYCLGGTPIDVNVDHQPTDLFMLNIEKL